jgi:hypothetical protein
MKERDQLADIDFVKVDYAAYLQKQRSMLLLKILLITSSSTL